MASFLYQRYFNTIKRKKNYEVSLSFLLSQFLYDNTFSERKLYNFIVSKIYIRRMNENHSWNELIKKFFLLYKCKEK